MEDGTGVRGLRSRTLGFGRLCAASVLVGIAFGCSDSAPPASTPAPAPSAPQPSVAETPKLSASAGAEASQEKLFARGRAVYVANCTACHNADPALDGSLGPATAGSSIELLEARLLTNSYPEGYTPKRDSRVMVALPYLKDDIPALAAYLAH